MGKIVCAIENCSRTRQSQNSGGSPSQRISFFSFPKEDDGGVLDKWLEFVNQHNVNKLDKETLDRKRLRLCHLHFQRKDISLKGKKDRVLIRNSVPERHAVKHNTKPKLKSTKVQQKATPDKASPAPEPTPQTPPPAAAALPTPTTTPSTDAAEADDASKPPDSAPLYHSINGYVVDLRFASQLEMFRLPNGKLIQVRKQAKKTAPGSATTAAPETPSSEGEPGSEKEKNKEQPGVTEVVPDVSKKAEVLVVPDVSKKPEVLVVPDVSKKPELSVIPIVSKKPELLVVSSAAKKKAERAAKKMPKKLVQAPPEPEKPTVPVHYKTYTNRRSQGVPVPATASLASITLPDAVPTPEPPTPPPAPVRTLNPMPQTQPQRARRPIVAPCLTALQSLVFKPHDEITPFDLFQKQFENQLISTAEIGLHVVAKINNLINSNPFKTAETEQDLKYMYHHVGYILKYAIDRFTGLTEICANDIKNMGFNERSDLGPVFGATVKDPEPPTPETPTEATPAAAAAPAEPEPKEADDDDDCAIVEQQPDMIEIDSEDDDDDQADQPAPEKPTPTSNQPKVEQPTSRSLQICSDTESPEEDQRDRTSRSTSRSESEKSAEGEQQQQHQFIISEIAEPNDLIHQDSETTLKIANVIGQYYGQESEEEEEEEEEVEESNEAEPMEVDEQDGTVVTTEEEEEEEEETTELIEIIDGDDEQDADPEYSVVECGDGDYYLVTTDGDEV